MTEQKRFPLNQPVLHVRICKYNYKNVGYLLLHCQFASIAWRLIEILFGQLMVLPAKVSEARVRRSSKRRWKSAPIGYLFIYLGIYGWRNRQIFECVE